MNRFNIMLAGINDVMNNSEPIGERLMFGLKMMFFGMAVVFSVIAILYLVLLVFGKVSANINKKKKVADDNAETTVAPLTATGEKQIDDSEIIAAITAAVAAVIDSENAETGEVKGFRVVSFRRSGKVTPWNG